MARALLFALIELERLRNLDEQKRRLTSPQTSRTMSTGKRNVDFLTHKLFSDINSREYKVPKKERGDKLQGICRVCLKEGNIPIYGNDVYKDVSEALNTFGGINIQSDDGFPAYLCDTCSALLQSAILLRKTAQKSDQLLRRPPPTKRKIPPLLNMKEMEIKKYRKKEPKLENYTCDECGKELNLKAKLKRHQLVHSCELPFKCTSCPYRGRYAASLKLHIRQHTGERPYQCSQCASQFTNKSNLNKHELTHTGPSAFKCETCNRGFYTKRNLDLHIKVDHNGIKEHLCNICGKAFGYRKQMMKHQLKVHKRQKMRNGRMPAYLELEQKQLEKQLNELNDKQIVSQHNENKLDVTIMIEKCHDLH